ncbi:MAG: hypothetical protein RR444_10270 [Oscillospiraceae bacterium]
MDTLDELVYYCNEGEPVGALLLTGEWGCGKTYLLDHDFRKKSKIVPLYSEYHCLV